MADSEAMSVPAAPPPPAPETLGQLLRNARLAQDLTLEQLSTELRIEARQLAALEDNRFEQIGVPVFVKGYLKQYGTRLGINVADLLALYYKQTTLADVQVQPSRTIKLRDESQIASWIVAALVLLAIVAGLAWWWNGGDFGSLPLTRSAPESATTSAPAPAEVEPAAQSAPQSVEQSPVLLPAAAPSASDAPVIDGASGAVLGGAAGASADSGDSTAFTAPDESGDDEQAEPAAEE